MDFTFPEEYRQVQALVRRYVEEYLRPYEQQVDEAEDFPLPLRRKLTAKAVEIGIYAMNMPAEVGGGGLPNLAMCLVREELGKTSRALGGVAGPVEGPSLILLACSEAQRPTYLLPAVRGERIACFALTEPNAGSDAAAIETTAARTANGYVLNGSKIFITNADVADFAIVFAVTAKGKGARGVSAFLVDQGTPGFTVGRAQPMMGMHGIHECELAFEDCEVPAASLLGPENGGFILAMQRIVGTRLMLSSNAVGAADYLLELSRAYAENRVQFGKPIAANQAIQWMLVEMAVDVYAARMMSYNVAWAADQGEDVRVKSALLKIYAAEMACRAADHALQIHGGMGYTRDLPIERFYRDLRLSRLVDGSSEILRHVVARDLVPGAFMKS